MAKNIISLSEVDMVVRSTNDYQIMIDELKGFIMEDIYNLNMSVHMYEGSKTIMTVGNMYTMLVMLKPYNTFKELAIGKEDILKDYSNVGSYAGYYDNLIEKFHNTYEDSYKIVTELMEDITYTINEVSIFSQKYVLAETGPTVSIKDIMDIGKRNPEFRETMAFSHDEHTSHLDNIKDKIKLQDENNSRSIDIILDDKENQFRRLLESGGGINVDQMGEVINVIGYKPDMRGQVVTKPINRSFFQGFNDVQDFFTDALGARKALSTSKLQVRQSGYLNRKISILTEDVRISEDKFCDTSNYMKVKITSDDMFELFIGRYHRVQDKDVLISGYDTYLVGHTINLYSPVTCALDGENICKKCYGTLANVNMGLNVGTIANLIFTEPLTQKLLSTKHLLKVEIDFKWDDRFLKFFSIEGNIISPRDPELEVYIDEEDLVSHENYNTNRFRTKKFYIINENDEREYLTSPSQLLIPDSSIERISDFWDEEEEAFRLSAFELTGTDHLFTVIIKNTGVADPLMEMKDALDKNHSMNKKHKQDLYSYFQDLMELLVKSHTYVMGVHIEVILRCMVIFNDRKVLLDDSIDILEMTNEEENERKYYKIYNINDSIYHSESPVKALMYQQTVRQLGTDSFNRLLNKTGESEFDRLYMTKETE